MKKSVTNKSTSVTATSHTWHSNTVTGTAVFKEALVLNMRSHWIILVARPLHALSRMLLFTEVNWLHLCIEITAVHPIK